MEPLDQLLSLRLGYYSSMNFSFRRRVHHVLASAHKSRGMRDNEQGGSAHSGCERMPLCRPCAPAAGSPALKHGRVLRGRQKVTRNAVPPVLKKDGPSRNRTALPLTSRVFRSRTRASPRARILLGCSSSCPGAWPSRKPACSARSRSRIFRDALGGREEPRYEIHLFTAR